mmetsp:Transcript_44425/g.62336  ORF Transcript_44425/g.62336 Transcript_44425/m.62336 type:complete len:437 (-) Transcript_44425:73-1383(-)|eukprot:CAMPEP_0201498916 /NCGR_PEP_ID=MMETSP0151_2-20130828/73631_1 /ASSEMBLY_ACC=CAM_ASM_000257 /TAXON_ID=200890 /ORGANISM="Paramoeba atlantica, Strain 621/1 / CCAP 1560/9" /LENGTH=436 /DNA_ID=CAMNT_0047890845 /DNA_START=46 /DNA_END=1356 /DNA_ORIENTATION=-
MAPTGPPCLRAVVVLLLLCVVDLPFSCAQSFSEYNFGKCEAREYHAPHALVILLDGVRADLVQNNSLFLPSLTGLMSDGVFAECESVANDTCARTQLGSRISDFPLPLSQIGPQDRLDRQSALEAQELYHWFGFNGFGAVLSGLDAPRLEVKGDDEESRFRFADLMATRDGTFVMQAHKKKNSKVAVAGVAPFLTTNFLSRPGGNVFGVLDYECGYDDNGRPLVDTFATSSCNSDFRYSVPSSVYQDRGDEAIIAFGVEVIEHGCAQLVVLHLKAPDIAMHTYGIESDEYRTALIQTDLLLARLLTAVQRARWGFRQTWAVMTTSDHGGVASNLAPEVFDLETGGLNRMDHDQNWDSDEAVPFILTLYSDDADFGLDDEFAAPPRNFDLAPTVLDFFEIESDDVYDGIAQGFFRASSSALQCSFLVIFVGLIAAFA